VAASPVSEVAVIVVVPVQDPAAVVKISRQ